MMSWRYPLFLDLLAFLAGASLTCAFAPYHLWPLAMLAPLILLWSWENASPRRAAWRGGLFGLGLFGTGIYWIFISLHSYGHAPSAFAALATLLVVLLMALYPSMVGWLLVRLTPDAGAIRWLVLFPALWSVLDWLRSWLFTGFPWLAIGYSQIDAPLGQLAPYLGVLGVGWAVIFSSGLIWTMAQYRTGRWLAGGGLLLLWVTAWGLGKLTWVEAVGTPLRIAIIQGNIAQDQKWQADFLDSTLERYVRLSLAEHGQSQVIIWPETAIPIFYEQARNFIGALANRAQQDGVDYVAGIPTGSWETKIFRNSVAKIGADLQFYHKRRLLPFGEYLPLRTLFMFFRTWVKIPMADFTPGADEQPLLTAGGQAVGVSICFEAVFAEEIRHALPQATWLINVSNDAWFQDSSAPHQHLQIARMRALESARYMARATNTGISAIIDAQGKIVQRGAQFVEEVVRGTVQPLRGRTPYMRIGDLPLVILMGILIILGWWQQRIPTKQKRP